MNETYEDSIKYILSEISRIAQMDPREAIKMPFPDNMAMFPHPSGNGSMLCGIKAYRRLQSVSELAVSRSKFSGKIDTDTVFKSLQNIIVERFIKEKRDISQKEADRAVSIAVKQASKVVVDLTHFIPCHLGNIDSPASFIIGPVCFKRCDGVLSDLYPAFQRYLSQKDGDEEIGQRLLNDTTEYYKSFGWVAEIKIDGCEPSISRKRALRMAQNAIDCLHLYLGAAYSNHMRVGGPYFYTDKRGYIEINSDGSAGISISVDWLSHNLPKDWWGQLSSDDRDKQLIALIGTAILAGNSLPKSMPLAQRFLDGLSWYGEAVRDAFQASRLIKYVTAMERILITKNEENLVNVFSNRGAALIFYPEEDELEGLKRRFRNVYDLRSKLVHGSRSPHESGLGEGLREAEDLAKSVLFRSVQFFREDGINSKNLSAKKLDESYDKLINWAISFVKSVEDEQA